MSGFTFTQTMSFGVSNGPTYQGQNIVLCNLLGTENYRDYPSLCLNNIATVIDASGFLIANWKAMGFAMSVAPVQTGAPNAAELLAATVEVFFEHGLFGGITDYSFTLGVGEAKSWTVVPPTLVCDVDSIFVTGDAVVDCNVYGLLCLNA